MFTSKPGRMIEEFLAQESAAGIMLFAAAIVALIASNTDLAAVYTGFLDTPVALQIGALSIAKPLLLWINDGLMALFFLLIGLEVKREMVEGELSSLSKAVLPLMGAIGGMLVPTLVFVAINWHAPATLKGWAIPAATDIAFALGLLALLGHRIPAQLKILLLAIAIIDDIGAIVIIALFHTNDVSALALACAALTCLMLVVLNRSGVRRLAPYLMLGLVLWVCVLKSGVHATLAGVVTALAIPLREKNGISPLKHLEHALHPWIAFAVLPLFAFANAGVSFAGIGFSDLRGSLPLGVALGLFVGKQVGVFGFIAGAIFFNWAKKPAGVSWRQIYGLACLTGIGFTMSLFIGTLAFDGATDIQAVKIGVIAGSVASGLLGFALLRTRAPTMLTTVESTTG